MHALLILKKEKSCQDNYCICCAAVFASRQIVAHHLKRVVSCRQIVAQHLKTVVACTQSVAQDLKAVVASRQIVAQHLMTGRRARRLEQHGPATWGRGGTNALDSGQVGCENE